MINIIAAIAFNNVIGLHGRIPWKLRADQRSFVELTMNHTVIVGRVTFESFRNDLPDRKVIVLTKQQDYVATAENVFIAHSIGQALELTKGDKEVFIAGGQQIYDLFIELVDRIYLTRVLSAFRGDTFFPEINLEKWRLASQTGEYRDKASGLGYTQEVYLRN